MRNMSSKITAISFSAMPLGVFAATRLDDSYMQLETRLQPIPAYAYWLIALGVLLALAAVASCLYFWWKRRAARLAIPPTPYEVASLALQALLSEGLPERGESKQFHQRLSGILRQYLEERLQISAPRLTTEEFLALLSCTPEMVKENRLLLQNFLNACDMVKFAGATALPADMQHLADSCREFLNRTRENPVQENPEGRS